MPSSLPYFLYLLCLLVVTTTNAWNDYAKEIQFRNLDKASKVTDVKVPK